MDAADLASTKCGGELKDVLEECTRLLVCDDDFSCRIEREINEQRKSAQKSILVCHYTLVTQASGGARSSSTTTALDAIAISPAVKSSGYVSRTVLRSRRASRSARSSSTTSMQRACANGALQGEMVCGPAPSLSARRSTPSTGF